MYVLFFIGYSVIMVNLETLNHSEKTSDSVENKNNGKETFSD